MNRELELLIKIIKAIENPKRSNVYSDWIKESHEWASKNCDYDKCPFDCECCYYAFINRNKEFK